MLNQINFLKSDEFIRIPLFHEYFSKGLDLSESSSNILNCTNYKKGDNDFNVQEVENNDIEVKLYAPLTKNQTSKVQKELYPTSAQDKSLPTVELKEKVIRRVHNYKMFPAEIGVWVEKYFYNRAEPASAPKFRFCYMMYFMKGSEIELVTSQEKGKLLLSNCQVDESTPQKV